MRVLISGQTDNVEDIRRSGNPLSVGHKTVVLPSHV